MERVTRKSVDDLMKSPNIRTAVSKARADAFARGNSLPSPQFSNQPLSLDTPLPKPATSVRRSTGGMQYPEYAPAAGRLTEALPSAQGAMGVLGAARGTPAMSSTLEGGLSMSPSTGAPVSRALPKAGELAVPTSAATMSQRLRSGYYNPQGSPTPAVPEDVLAARQRVAADLGLMNSQGRMVGGGGIPVSQARALSEGRSDAATRIANARGKAMLPSYPSPLDGTAGQFQALAAREAADIKAADAKAVEQYQRYRTARDADTNGNGIPDRDEAVASKYGNMGITNVNDLQVASAKYNNYMRQFRRSGLQDQMRPMSFDEFAKNQQEQRKSLPVFGLDTPQAAPSGATTPTQDRVDARRVGLQNMRERQDMMAQNAMYMNLTPQERANIVTQNTALAGNLAEIQGRKSQSDAALAQQQLQFDLQMAQTQAEREAAQRRFDLQMAEIRNANEIAQGEFGLRQDEAERRRQIQGLELGMKAQDPLIVAQQAMPGLVEAERAAGYSGSEAVQRANAKALMLAQSAAAQRQMLRGAGIDLPPDMPLPEQIPYMADRESPALDGSLSPASPQQVVQLHRLAVDKARREGKALTTDEFNRILKDNNLYMTPETAGQLATLASEEGAGFMFEQLPGARETYRTIYGTVPSRQLNMLQATSPLTASIYDAGNVAYQMLRPRQPHESTFRAPRPDLTVP